jgi:hypothetical protein
MGTAYRHLGLLALAKGDPVGAQSYIHKSLDLFVGHITGWDVVQSLVYLGEATAAAGELLEARRIFVDTLRGAMEAQTAPLAMDALTGLAKLQARAGQAEQALEFSAHVLCHPASTQQAKDSAAQVGQQLKSQLTPQQAEAAQARAQAKSLENLMAELLPYATPLKS